jgi:hypothetical protein
VQSSKQQDSVLMSGDLEIIVRQINTQKILRTIRIKNTITFEGTSSLVRLLAQDGVVLTDYQIDTLKVGSNGTPPTRGDAALGTLVLSKTLTSGNRLQSLTTSELIIQTQLGPLDAVGSTLREVGLFFKNGVLAARQIYPEILKTSLITVSYTWRIGFATN